MNNVARIDQGCATCPTRSLCAARDLDVADMAVLTDCIAITAPMTRGEFLYRAGDPSESWFVVRSGAYKTITVTTDGEEYVTGFYYPGEILGLDGSGGSGGSDGSASGRFSETAIALGSATACRIALDELQRMWPLGNGRTILRLIAEHNRLHTLLRINLSQSRAEVRIAGFFKLLMDRTGRLGFDVTCLPLPMSRTDLSNHLGLTLECVSRVLSKWRKAGVIDTDRNTVQLLKPDALVTTAYHLAA